MKRILTIIAAIAVSVHAFSQAPQKMSYQAVIRDADKKLVTTQVGMRISILQGSETGTPCYVEIQNPTPNDNGLVSIEIGSGTPVTGTFAGIDWSAGPYYIKTETAVIAPLTTYTIEGTSQILSVPYALHAKTVASYPETDPIFEAWNKSTGINISASQISDFQTSVTNNSSVMANTAKNSYPAADASKLAGISGGAEVNVNADWNATSGDAQILNKPEGSNPGDMLYWNGANWTTVLVGRPGQFMQLSNSGIPTWSGAAYPTLTTTILTSIAQNTATSGGNITSDGDATITARGVCWNTSSNPITTDTHTSDGSGTGIFTSSITGLTASTLYYVRAYATNIIGTAYGNERIFTTISIVLPTIITTAASSITGTTATSGGNITFDGGESLTARGVCWNTSSNPVATGSHTSDGSLPGIFTSSITGLTLNTTYYIRAYAINSAGTAYGDEKSFTTLSTVSIGDSYQGGIVAYILQSGDPGFISGETHGLIAAPSDQGLAPWGCEGTTITGADGIAIGTGLQNTTDIVTGCSTSGIAAKLCFDLILSDYSDWYLPSQDELNKLYVNKLGIGGFASGSYWSSTEKSSTSALSQSFINGSQISGAKHNTGYVRPVRSF